ncbi:lytic transglycosylase domain-containing protein [Streptomyces sp. NPDC004629]|uniref:lytic transglycosylase domain-containing protein n=1 Tax=Streptomyces sp. NPDC004629 TaxID=3364705 RepID=UPI0036841618
MSDSRAPRRRRWLPVLVFAFAVYVIVRAANTPQGDTPPPPGSSASSSHAPTGGPSATAAAEAAFSYDPADYTRQVRDRARRTGVSARLLMAILYNESYKPHDPGLERAWQKYRPDASFGIANMHRAAFDEVKTGRDFADRRWEELPDDRDLAIEAEAWYLHDLGGRLPAEWPAAYDRNELLALGYNTGAGTMPAFARGTPPGGQARTYLDKLHANWAEAGRAIGV